MPSRVNSIIDSIIDRHGKRRHYFRRSGQKSVTLPGAWGSPEFQAAYRAALAGETAPPIEIGSRHSKPGSVAAAVALYLGSMNYGVLTDATRRDRRRILEHFRESFGDRPLAGLERKHVEPMVAAMAGQPHAAKHFLKALRGFVAVALRAGLLDGDPTAGIRIKIRATEGHRTWIEDDIAQIRGPLANWNTRTARARVAALPGATARRRDPHGASDVRDGVLTVRQAKTGATVAIPIHPGLQTILAASEANT